MKPGPPDETAYDVLKVFDEATLVAISSEEGDHFFVVHAAIDGTLRDLEAIDVNNGDHGTRLSRIDVLGGVPGRSGRTTLSFTVTDLGCCDQSTALLGIETEVSYLDNTDKIWLIHDSTKSHTQCTVRQISIVQ
jgi:hypothetical protein